ncbi:MAG: hypothetical protein ACRDSJ_16285, partial [Rubrobacteraceae bacterium]
IWKIRPEPTDRPFSNTHEIWSLDGRESLYHGRDFSPDTGERRNFFGFCDPGGEEYREYFFRRDEDPTGRYGHFTPHPSRNHAYWDGHPQLISEVFPGPDGYARTRPVCRHDTRWMGQDDHPHPVLGPDLETLIYTSSSEGTGNVYGVRL